MIDDKAKAFYNSIEPTDGLKQKIVALESKKTIRYPYVKAVAMASVAFFCFIQLSSNQIDTPMVPVVTQLESISSISEDVRTLTSDDIQIELEIQCVGDTVLYVNEGQLVDTLGDKVELIKKDSYVTWSIEAYDETKPFCLFVQYDNHTDEYTLIQNENLEWIIERGKE